MQRVIMAATKKPQLTMPAVNGAITSGISAYPSSRAFLSTAEARIGTKKFAIKTTSTPTTTKTNQDDAGRLILLPTTSLLGGA